MKNIGRLFARRAKLSIKKTRGFTDAELLEYWKLVGMWLLMSLIGRVYSTCLKLIAVNIFTLGGILKPLIINKGYLSEGIRVLRVIRVL